MEHCSFFALDPKHSEAICIAAEFERTIANYGMRGSGYVYVEAGRSAESLMLQAIALGLARTLVGAFNDKDVRRFFRLRVNEPLCAQSLSEHPKAYPDSKWKRELGNLS